jgi:hypothetical protein
MHGQMADSKKTKALPQGQIETQLTKLEDAEITATACRLAR